MKTDNLISIIAPAHNEEGLIQKFVNEVTKSCEKWELNYELTIVENGSSDNTAKKVIELIPKNNRISLIQLDKAGYGLAIIEGLRASKGDFVVIFNIDFWDERFLALTKVDLLEYDIVSGSKLLPGSKDLRGFNRKVISWGFTKFLQMFLGFKGTDTHGIKVLRLKKVLPFVKSCVTTSGIFDSELILRSQKGGIRILEIPVEVKEVRPARFNITRILKTPLDMFQLWKALQ